MTVLSFLRKVVWANDRSRPPPEASGVRRLLLKSPFHTARIKLLLELFPAGPSLQEPAVAVAEVDLLEKQVIDTVRQRWPSLMVAFRALDLDHDQALERNEFGTAIRTVLGLDPAPAVLDELWTRWDADVSGQLTFEEFGRLFGRRRDQKNLVTSDNINVIKRMVREAIESRVPDNGLQLRGAFHFFDKDRSGSLNYAEMAAGVEKLAGVVLDDAIMAKLMDEYDPERKGEINFQDFTRCVLEH